MPVIRVNDQEMVGGPGWEMRGLATRANGSKEVRVTRAKGKIEKAASSPAQPHTHDHDEIMVVLAGPVKHQVGKETVTLSAGDVLIVPAGVPHVAIMQPGQTFEAVTVQLAGTKYFGADGKEVPPPPGRAKW